MCITRSEKVPAAGRDNTKSTHPARRWKVTRHKKLKFLSILTEVRYLKIHVSSGSSFVKKQKQRNIYKSATGDCQSGILSQDVIGLTNADQQS